MSTMRSAKTRFAYQFICILRWINSVPVHCAFNSDLCALGGPEAKQLCALVHTSLPPIALHSLSLSPRGKPCVHQVHFQGTNRNFL